MVVTGALYVNQRQQRDAVNDIVNRQLQLSRVFSLLQDAETSQRGYLLAGSDAYLEPFQRADAALPSAFDELASQFAHAPALANDLATLHQLANGKMDELRR